MSDSLWAGSGCSQDDLGLTLCAPWDYPSVFRTTFSGKRSTLSTAPMKGEGRLMERHHWDIFLEWLC